MKVLKPILSIVLLACICGLVYLIYDSVSQPVEFNKEKSRRENVAIQNLKDIRTLQVAFKSVNNHFAGTIDSLKTFYETGEMSVIMQVGSHDDSLAVAKTDAIKKSLKGVKPSEMNAKLYELYKQGEKNLVFSVETKVAVKDTLFKGRENFDINKLKYIPYADGDEVEMNSIIKMVSGVQVPLFEAKIPYKKLLKGLDNQLRINLDAQRRDQNKYEGLQVGSIEAPNNNAGNWE
ncbi:MAG: hypothetical protein MJZ16_06445 [Bacteroidales bacterium]|nr:hypothetical protein [Bacteroidales bacterium]